MKIALVIGHRQGAKGAWGNMGISEFDFFTKFVNELLKRLNNEHLHHEFVIFYRNDGLDNYSHRMRYLHKAIDAWGADLSVSFHFNAFGKQEVNGHEILYCSEKGMEYAIQLDELFDAYLDNADRGIKKTKLKERGGGFLCRGNSTCILVEPFFASHQNRFVEGGDQRELLKQAFVDFFASI